MNSEVYLLLQSALMLLNVLTPMTSLLEVCSLRLAPGIFWMPIDALEVYT